MLCTYVLLKGMEELLVLLLLCVIAQLGLYTLCYKCGTNIGRLETIQYCFTLKFYNTKQSAFYSCVVGILFSAGYYHLQYN